jgi:hypothetical protein
MLVMGNVMGWVTWPNLGGWGHYKSIRFLINTTCMSIVIHATTFFIYNKLFFVSD